MDGFQQSKQCNLIGIHGMFFTNIAKLERKRRVHVTYNHQSRPGERFSALYS